MMTHILKLDNIGQRNLLVALLILFFTPCNDALAQGIEVRAMTYNIRYDNPNDGIHRWDARKAYVVRLLKYYSPDIIGIQEGLDHQVRYLDKALKGYGRVGVGRDDGKEAGEYTAIYYNSEKFELVEQGTFWLSPTPDVVSVGWDASMERICTFLRVRNKATDQSILVFNAHFDHMGTEARTNSAKLIIDKLEMINESNEPAIVMGDLNAIPESRPIEILEDAINGKDQENPFSIYGPRGTYTGFNLETLPENRIDYIFSKGLNVLKYRHIDDRRKGYLYISDHLPVMADLVIDK